MKTELEKKLGKLPDEIMYENTSFSLNITKINVGKGSNWFINYIDKADNSLILVEHQSLQAAVDTTLKEIKNL